MSGTVTNRVVIQVTSQGVPVVRRDIESIGHASRGARTLVEDLKEALKFAGLAFGLKEIVDRMDAVTALGNKMRAVGIAIADVNTVFQRLMEISNRTYTNIEQTGNMFSRLQLVMNQFGYSTNEAIRMTNSLATALSLSGATNQEATYGLMDLVHGLSAGSITSREFRGLMQALPAVVQALADGLGVTVGKLTEMIHSKEKLTSNQVFKAFLNQENALMMRQAEIIPTIKNALQVLRNEFTAFLGGQNAATGVGKDFAAVILLMAQNMHILGRALEVALALFLALRVVPAIVHSINASLLLLVRANPFGLMLGAIVGTIAALVAFREEINLGLGDTTNLGHLMTAAWEKLGPVVSEAVSTVKTHLSSLNQSIAAYLATWDIQFPQSTQEWLRAIARVIDISATYVGIGAHGIAFAWRHMGTVLHDITISMANVIQTVFETMVNGVIDLINKIPAAGSAVINKLTSTLDAIRNYGSTPGSVSGPKDSMFGAVALPQIPRVSIAPVQQTDALKAELAKAQAELAEFGKTMAEFARKAETGQGVLVSALDGIVPRAQELARIQEALKKAQEAATAARLAAPGKGGFTPHHKEDTKKGPDINRWLDQILGKYDPVTKAIRGWAKEEADLQKALSMGLITQEQYARAIAVGTDFVKSRIDPLGHLNSLYEEQQRILGKVGDDQRVASELERSRLDLLRRGVVLTEQQTEALQKLIAQTEHLNQVNHQANAIWQQFGGAFETYRAGLEGAKLLMDQGKISAEQYALAVKDIELAYLKTGTDGASGLKAGLLEVQKTAGDTAGLMSKSVVDLFSGFEDAIIQFTQTGELSFKSMADAFEASIIRMALRVLIEKPILDMLFGAGGGNSAPGAGTGGLLGQLGTMIGSVFSGSSGVAGDAAASIGSSLPGFANGGGFEVGGAGGTDSQVVSFRATPGEHVQVSTPAQRAGNGDNTPASVHMNYNIYANDPNAFRKTQAQILTEAGRVLSGVLRRNG